MSQPFDDIRALLSDLPIADENARKEAMARQARLVKPAGALGRLEEIAVFLAGWQGRARPLIRRPMVAVFAGNHGIAARGVSAYPPGVTRAMVQAFADGGAAINQLCASLDLGLKVFELALEAPTEDITRAPAMDERTCAATIAYGMEAVAGGVDLLCVGEMGIGNTTVAAALYHALYGGEAEDWVGLGTGVDAAGKARKIEAVRAAVALHGAHRHDPLELLRRLGGREVAAIAGAILAARTQRIPVVLDGYVATAAAAMLHALRPDAIAHCLAGHRSAEGAHGEVLGRLGLRPILDLGMRLGEGSGAALSVAVIRAALACHDGMASFDEAAVPVALA